MQNVNPSLEGIQMSENALEAHLNCFVNKRYIKGEKCAKFVLLSFDERVDNLRQLFRKYRRLKS